MSLVEGRCNGREDATVPSSEPTGVEACNTANGASYTVSAPCPFPLAPAPCPAKGHLYCRQCACNMLQYRSRLHALELATAILLPNTKTLCHGLAWLHGTKIDQYIDQYTDQ